MMLVIYISYLGIEKCVYAAFAFLNRPEDVQALVSGKLALRYAGRQVSIDWTLLQWIKQKACFS